VTGSLDRVDERSRRAAAREVAEETGIDAAGGTLTRWPVANTSRSMRVGAPLRAGVTHNTEHVFGLRLEARHRSACRPAEAYGVRLAALAGSGAEVLLLVQPRRHPDAGRKSAV